MAEKKHALEGWTTAAGTPVFVSDASLIAGQASHKVRYEQALQEGEVKRAGLKMRDESVDPLKELEDAVQAVAAVDRDPRSGTYECVGLSHAHRVRVNACVYLCVYACVRVITFVRVGWEGINMLNFLITTFLSFFLSCRSRGSSSKPCRSSSTRCSSIGKGFRGRPPSSIPSDWCPE